MADIASDTRQTGTGDPEQETGNSSPSTPPFSQSLSLSVSPSVTAPAKTPFKIQLADRLTKLPPYVLARVNALRDAKRKAGQDVIDLGMGNPSEPPQEIVIEKLMEAARDPDNHGYSKAN